ncbi:MAG: hypothetical protein GY820_28195 [Gammaproteobacteria bacterium]|nr:hypothetical protein [Gammaproteobacteria bacterium]
MVLLCSIRRRRPNIVRQARRIRRQVRFSRRHKMKTATEKKTRRKRKREKDATKTDQSPAIEITSCYCSGYAIICLASLRTMTRVVDFP